MDEIREEHRPLGMIDIPHLAQLPYEKLMLEIEAWVAGVIYREAQRRCGGDGEKVPSMALSLFRAHMDSTDNYLAYQHWNHALSGHSAYAHFLEEVYDAPA